MRPARLAYWALAALLVALGLFFGARGPQLTLANTALVVAYPASAPAGRLMAALGFAGMALLLRGKLRLAPGALTALLLLLALQDGLYQLRADEQGLELRGLGGRQSLAWSALQRLDTSPSRLEAVGPEGQVLSMDVSRLQPADRASLERTIARRLREASEKRAR